MEFLKRHGKRIGIDTAGYLLLLAAIATGWLPGPGGIPLALAGLGLLSINNAWAKRIRDYLLENGGKVVKVLFPANSWVQCLYDILVVLLFALSIWLEVRHAAIWQISVGIAAFCFAGFIALMNRERLDMLKTRRQKHRKH